jgi:aldehyde:ferredoxin oxidoreductase
MAQLAVQALDRILGDDSEWRESRGTAIQLIEQTGAGVGAGEALRLGTSRAAELLGAPDLAMSVKGISLQNCDPRPEPAWGRTRLARPRPATKVAIRSLANRGCASHA